MRPGHRTPLPPHKSLAERAASRIVSSWLLARVICATASSPPRRSSTATEQCPAGPDVFAGGWGAQRAAVCGAPESELGALYAKRTLLGREVPPEHVAAAVVTLTAGELSLALAYPGQSQRALLPGADSVADRGPDHIAWVARRSAGPAHVLVRPNRTSAGAEVLRPARAVQVEYGQRDAGISRGRDQAAVISRGPPSRPGATAHRPRPTAHGPRATGQGHGPGAAGSAIDPRHSHYVARALALSIFYSIK